MAPRQRRGTRLLRIVFVSREERAERTKIAKIASVLGMETRKQVTEAAIELLSIAAGFAEQHGSQHVVLGVKRKWFTSSLNRTNSPPTDEVQRVKLLMIVRIGHIGTSSELSERGSEDMDRLAQRLRPLLRDLHVRILTSPAIPAYQSAKILARAHRCGEPVFLDCLYSGPDHPPNLPVTVETVLKSRETEQALILVTHHEHARDLPSRMCQALFGRAYPEKTLPPATAIAISLETKSVSIVS